MKKYNPDEEVTFRQELFRRMDTQDSTLKRIEEQTSKHDSRMTTLETRLIGYEKWKDILSSLEGWKMWLTGAVAVIIIVGAFVWHLVISNVLQQAQTASQQSIEQLKTQILQDTISEINRNYNLNVK